jgi:hypothetical protein
MVAGLKKISLFNLTKVMRLFFIMIGVAIIVDGCCSDNTSRDVDKQHAIHHVIFVSPLSANEDSTVARIRIGREVKNPGYFHWVSGMTLTDAVNSAGGLSVFAARSKIRVFHEFHEKHSLAGIYDYDAILKQKAEDPILMSGDYIFVGGSLD